MLRSARRSVLGLAALTLFGIVAPRAGMATTRGPHAPVGILGVRTEIEVLIHQMKDRHTVSILGLPFVTGALQGRSVVVSICGVGKVNAASTATLMIDHFHPRDILFSGSAGALNPDLAPGDVVIGLRTAQHDVGTLTDQGLKREPTGGLRADNPMFFPGDAELLGAARRAVAGITFSPVTFGATTHRPHIIEGTIITGDIFVAARASSDAMREELKADAVEEEGAAVAQICWQQHVPFLAIRSISDNANQDTPTNYKKFYALAAQNSARLVTGIVSRLRN